MGRGQDTAPGRRRRRPRPRTCLRKGCGVKYAPIRWNQRYCGDPACLRLVRRWRARKRQRRRRATQAGRERHREAERERRRRRRQRPQTRCGGPSGSSSHRARGHAGEPAPGAPICDRPGCYDPPRPSVRARACYCGRPCRAAVRCVVDRERKWLLRATEAGRIKRRHEYARRNEQRARRRDEERGTATPGPGPPPP